MDRQRHPEVLVGFEERFRGILAHRPRGIGWSWADALYMAPPTLVRLAQATGDSRYLDLAYSEFAATHATLYGGSVPPYPATDGERSRNNLYYRDARYFEQRAANGEKVFWSRGNGWVYAGLADVLDGVPAEHPSREFYLQAFEDMSPAILAAQQHDGLWYPSLLDPQQVPIGETSGSALLLSGLAWGINQGILDRDTYMPAVQRGWQGLLSRITANGEVDFVQPIGAEPKPFDPANSEPYGTGAVLSAAAEILKMSQSTPTIDAVLLRGGAELLVNESPALTVEATH